MNELKRLESAVVDFTLVQSGTNLLAIKNELNNFFKKAKCVDIIYTRNDKLFFGMCVIPVMSGDQAIDKLMNTKEKHVVDSYYIEIDSKLMNIGLTPKELTAVLLHEVGHLVNSPEPLQKTRDAINIYLAKNGESLSIPDSVQYKEMIAFAIKNTMCKFSSMFYMRDEEVIADNFVFQCGYDVPLIDALKKITANVGTINRDAKSSKLAVLQWTLRVYREVGLKRIPALRTLQRSRELTGSVLTCREIDKMTKAINTVDSPVMVEEAVKLLRKNNPIRKNMIYKGKKSLEEDLFELKMRAKNVDEEDEALIIMRKINERIGMINDFIVNDLQTEEEREPWYELRLEYHNLREQLADKKVYTDKYYGLFVNTPVIKSRYEM